MMKKHRKEKIGRPMIDHLGNRFISMAAMARAYKVNLSTLHRRLAEGHSMKESLTRSTVGHVHYRPQEVNGKKYRSIREMTTALGVPYHKVLYRIQKGEDAKTALRRFIK